MLKNTSNITEECSLNAQKILKSRIIISNPFIYSKKGSEKVVLLIVKQKSRLFIKWSLT